MARGEIFLCNTDNKPGYLCRRDGCQHTWIKYIPMAAGFRCDTCKTFQRDDLKNESMRQFHDYHARCPDRLTDPAQAPGSGAGGER